MVAGVAVIARAPGLPPGPRPVHPRPFPAHAMGRLTAAAGRRQPRRPKLSVTVLNYNYGRYLGRCLDSILRQTMTDFEVIVIDDASTDNSLDVIRPYLADRRVRLVSHRQNRGYVASLVEGTEAESRGIYATTISADD